MSAGDFEERVVTVPLRSVKANTSAQGADKAMSVVREHLAKQFAVETDAVRLDPSINEEIWSHSRSSPPSKIRVRAARFDEEGDAVVEAETA
jgi:large subunit ribosomal protein L31e